jgi:hypothetical protein
MSRGEFTRRFDREIMKDETVEKDELAALQALKTAERNALEEEFLKIEGILEHRAKWLHERFSDMNELKELDFRGRRFEFPKKPETVGAGWLEFRIRLTDTSLGILLECNMGIEGRFKKRYDYVVFPKENVNIERTRKFVESKLFEFAAEYQS